MARLHRTPTHTRMAREVFDQNIMWDSRLGLTGGFRYASPRRHLTPDERVALCELWFSKLLTVNAPVVALTDAAVDRFVTGAVS